jgi:MoaA/NifB/PqqE/SkfB family radical SAM enzyme
MSWLPPLLLHYYITERCNSRCSFCEIWRHPAGTMASLQDVKKNLQDAARLGVRFVDFTGGEPLLHPELPQMLRLARTAGLRTTLTTNAGHYPGRAAELTGVVDFLHFSLDAADPAAHDRLRGVPLFDAVMSSIDLARRLGEKPDILFTALPETLGHLPRLVEFCRRMGLVLVVNPVFSHRQNRELTTADLAFMEQYAHLPFVYVNRAFHLLRRKGGNDPLAPRCRVVDAVVVVSPQNELVLPCYHFEQNRISLEEGLYSTWNSSRVSTERRRQGRWPACRGCTVNCYFDPSFTYQIDAFFFKSMAAKMKYTLDKYLRHPVLRGLDRLDTRPAEEIMTEIRLAGRESA